MTKNSDAGTISGMGNALFHCWGGHNLYLVDGVEPADPPSRIDVEKTTRLERSRVLSVLSGLVTPMDRCLAAVAIEHELLREIVSRPHASNMQNAGRQIAPVLHELLRSARAPFSVLFKIYGLSSLEAQRAAVEQWQTEGLPKRAYKYKPRPEVRTRERGVIERIVARVGVRKVKRLVNELQAVR